MATTLNIFISSKMVELKPERDALYGLLPSLDYGDIELRAWVFEADAAASEDSIRQMYLDALSKSALYLGLFWNQYGEYTIDEFDRATEWGIERHIYVKDVEADKRESRLTEFLNKHGDVTTGITAKWFKTTDELCAAVKASIERWIAQRLMRRSSAPEAVYTNDPSLIPEKPRQLFGRETLQSEVEALLNDGERVLLQGFGGMGKTALAATIAADWLTRGPVLWIKAAQAETDALFEGLARPFNAQQAIAAATGQAKIDLLRQLLVASGTALFVIDDAWEGDTLAPIIQALPSNLPLLLTSRHRLPIGKRRAFAELSAQAALDLLSYHADADFGQPAAEGEAPGDAEMLCRKLGHHAFAIEIAGKTLNVDELRPAELLQRIEDAPHKLEVPEDLALDHRHSVADLIEVSLEALKAKDEFAYQIFLAFGAFFVPSATPELLSLHLNDP